MPKVDLGMIQVWGTADVHIGTYIYIWIYLLLFSGSPVVLKFSSHSSPMTEVITTAGL